MPSILGNYSAKLVSVDALRKKIASRLKELRLKKGLSISELSRQSGLSREYLRNLEMSDPPYRLTIETAYRIAKALRVPPEKLIILK